MPDLKDIKVGDFSITINNISETEGKLNHYYDAEDLPANSEFVTFDVTVKNNGDSEKELGTLLTFALAGEDGLECQYCVSDNVDNIELRSGASTDVKVSYIAPKNKQLHFRFTPDLIHGYYMDLPIMF